MLKPRVSSYVLDASAVLAVLLGEAGAGRVLTVAPQSVAPTVCVAEVAAKLHDKNLDGRSLLNWFADLGVGLVELDAVTAVASGDLRPRTSHKGMSLGDRICLAHAANAGAVAVTADRAWAGLDVGVEIELIR